MEGMNKVKWHRKPPESNVKKDIGTEGEIKLIPETENKLFFEGENDRQIEFELDRGQKVKKAWITASGIKYELN